MATIVLDVNGRSHEVQVRPHHTLLRILRDELGLAGPKRGCDTGGCGCCSVLLDGRVVYSCMVFASACEGKKIVTVEGLASNGEPDALQKSFVNEGAVQCGYCIPGFIMASKELLSRNGSPTEEEIRAAIAGNLCRCTGYQKIVKAIKTAAVAGRSG